MKGSGLRILLLAPMLAAYSRSQELDTVLLRERTASEQSTIIDQVSDPKERRAFLKLYEAHDPGKRRSLANAFLSAYPQSWLLSQVYEIASKACIDLEEYDEAIRFGSQSLRLLPENPLLLVPLANVQLQKGQLAAAKTNAGAAIEYLDQFDRPAAVAASKWPTVRAQLRASAYYVLGRVQMAAALRSNGTEKQEGLHRTEAFLRQAQTLNAQDAEIGYLLGLTEMSLGKPGIAAFYFAKISRTPGPFQEKALDNLRRIYASHPGSSSSFEMFVESNEREVGPESSPVTPGAGISEEKHESEYAGSQSCQPCHAVIYRSWQETGMGRMLRRFEPENVIGDFRVNNQFSDSSGTLVARMITNRDKRYFMIRDATGNWATYSVDYTIGSKWQQAYATRLPTRDIHVFPVQYNALTGKWINYWQMIDPPGSPRTEVTGFSKLTSATSYQLNCAPCHTSHLHLNRPGSSDGHDFEFAEGGINCEMCHGPGQKHVLAMSSGKALASGGGLAIVNFSAVAAGRYVAICGQCHAQSALRQPGPNGEMNYPSAGTAFPPVYSSRPYAEVARRAFYRDGRFRETTFIVEAFRRSACFRKGQAHCGYCHQPHGADASSNPTSLKFATDPDHMCLQCHSKFTPNPSAHTHHSPASEGSRCVACHMPRIMNSVLFKARTHQIDDIPDAEMTERFGPAESPNACLLCHADKNAQWAGMSLRSW
ncbi:MAG TPA: hypothetical protein VK335_02120 [Bryobacteraceae bacterium]|nr:hypothetical protein [Bryobacteraceae bacterium]